MILKKPLVTEKSSSLLDKKGKFGFVVDTKATKDEIKQAVESFYEVQVESVNTMIQRGKRARIAAQAKSPVILTSIKRPL